MKKTITTLYLILLTLGCVNQKKSGIELPEAVYKVRFSEVNSNSEKAVSPYGDAFFIPLETGRNSLLGEVEKIKTLNGKTFIADRQKIVEFIFDEDSKSGVVGKVMNNSGRGPGEYLKIMDFTIDDSSLFIYDGSKVNIYDINSWKFTKSITLKFNAIRMERHNNCLIFFTLHLQNAKEYDYEIITLNTISQEVHKYFKNSEKQFGTPAIGNQMNRIGADVYYCSPFRNVTYKFNKNSEPVIFAVWNYRSDGVVDLNNSMQSITQMESSDICYNFNEPRVVGNYLYIQFCYKGGYRCLWYNTVDKTLFTSRISSLPQTYCFKNNYFVSTFPSYEIVNLDKSRILNDTNALKIYSRVLDIKEDDNPCVRIEMINPE
jgi:hypothetical protein